MASVEHVRMIGLLHPAWELNTLLSIFSCGSFPDFRKLTPSSARYFEKLSIKNRPTHSSCQNVLKVT